MRVIVGLVKRAIPARGAMSHAIFVIAAKNAIPVRSRWSSREGRTRDPTYSDMPDVPAM